MFSERLEFTDWSRFKGNLEELLKIASLLFFHVESLGKMINYNFLFF